MKCGRKKEILLIPFLFRSIGAVCMGAVGVKFRRCNEKIKILLGVEDKMD